MHLWIVYYFAPDNSKNTTAYGEKNFMSRY